MKVLIISPGKDNDKAIAVAVDDYTKRTFSTLRTEWFFPVSGTKEKEAMSILNAIKKYDYVILLDEEGSQISSVDFAEFLGEKMNDSTQRIVFVIGGAYGVSSKVRERANYVWCLSKLVFPHMVVRLLLIEQLYRATSILRGAKYHHE